MENKEIEKLLKEFIQRRGLCIGYDGYKRTDSFDGEKFYDGEVCLKKAVDTMGAGDSFYIIFVVFTKKWMEKESENRRKNIKEAFRYAAEFAAENCLLNGAFGYGQPIE